MASTTTDRLAGVTAGLSSKSPVRCATTANLTLSGEQTIDAVAVVADDRVLVKNQTDGIENGIYLVKSGAWVRAPDFDGTRDVVSGTFVIVSEGTAGGGTAWRISTTGTITIGTTSIAFAQMSIETATAYILTLLDDTDEGTALTTLGVQRNFIAGLKTSNNGSDAAHDIDIAIGEAIDDGNTTLLKLTSAYTKQIDATWVVGTDQGGLDTGNVANTTLYAMWLIRRSDIGTVDILFSTSFTSPTMPTSYDEKRLISAVVTDGSANIVAFVQSGDYFRYKGDVITDINDGSITSDTFEAAALSVPPSSLAHIYAAALNASQNESTFYVTVRTNGAADVVGLNEAFHGADPNGTTADTLSGIGMVLVDSTSKIQYTTREASGAASVVISTLGFTMLTRRDP